MRARGTNARWQQRKRGALGSKRHRRHPRDCKRHVLWLYHTFRSPHRRIAVLEGLHRQEFHLVTRAEVLLARGLRD